MDRESLRSYVSFGERLVERSYKEAVDLGRMAEFWRDVAVVMMDRMWTIDDDAAKPALDTLPNSDLDLGWWELLAADIAEAR